MAPKCTQIERTTLLKKARELWPNPSMRRKYLRSIVLLRRGSGWVLEGGLAHYERGQVRSRTD
jgi:hypothetical protein